MARLGRSLYGLTRYRGPVVVSSQPPVAPLSVTLAVGLAVNQRRAQQRRTTLSRLSPPTVVNPPPPPPPPPGMFTTVTVLVAVSRRGAERRRFPLQGWEQEQGSLSAVEAITNSYVATDPGDSTLNLGASVTQSQLAQQFARLTGRPFSVTVRVATQGAPADGLQVQIQSDSAGVPSGVVLASSSVVPAASIPANAGSRTPQTTFFLDPSTPVTGPVWIVLLRTGAINAANFYTWIENSQVVHTAEGPYASLNTGVWTALTNRILSGIVQFWTTTNVIVHQRRFLGPRPPFAVLPVPTQPQQTISVSTFAARHRRGTDQQRAPRSHLSPPTVIAPASTATFFGPQVNLFPVTKTRPRRRVTFLFAPAVVAPPAPPTQQQQTIAVALTRQARHRGIVVLPKPQITAVTTFVALPIQTNLVDNREHGLGRRHFPSSFITPPAVLAVFSGPTVALAHIRPRRVVHALTQPTVVRVPSVEQLEQTVRVSLVRTRPRDTRTLLFPPVSLQTFSGPEVKLTQIRPRATRKFLAPPTVIRVPSVEQQEDTVRVCLVRTRPRPTRKFVVPPTVIRVPSVEQSEQTVRITLVRARPRPTTKALFEPTTLTEFFGPIEHEITVRIPLENKRRGTHYRLAPPTVVRVPSIEQQEQTIRVTLIRARPRPTVKTLSRPTTLQTFAGPFVALIKTKPRSTTTLLLPPTVIRVPSVEQAEDTIRVTLVRTRPRSTVRLLGEPTTLQTFPGPHVSITATRPRKTSYRIELPTVIRIPSVEQQEQTIRISLVRTRPRRTIWFLRAPTVSRVPSVEQIEQTIKTALHVTRPRPTIRRLSPPTVVITNPPVDTTVNVTLSGRTQIEAQRRVSRYKLNPPTAVIPLPTLRVQTIQVNLTKLARRFVRSKLARPTVISVTTFAASKTPLVKTRPRGTVTRLLSPQVVRVPTVEQALRTIHVALIKTHPRQTTRLVGQPTVLRIFQAAKVTLAQIKPRPTRRFLSAPTVIARQPVETQISTVLTRARPRPTVRHLGAPTVVRTPSVEQAQQTIRVELAAVSNRLTRLRKPQHDLSAPTVVTTPKPVLYSITIVLAGRTRLEEQKRASHYKLFAPAKVFGAPMIIRVTGPPQSAWATRRMSVGWETELPAGGLEAGKPIEGWETDTPGTDWEVGKPE